MICGFSQFRLCGLILDSWAKQQRGKFSLKFLGFLLIIIIQPLFRIFFTTTRLVREGRSFGSFLQIATETTRTANNRYPRLVITRSRRLTKRMKRVNTGKI
jgi:hypothetical protein